VATQIITHAPVDDNVITPGSSTPDAVGITICRHHHVEWRATPGRPGKCRPKDVRCWRHDRVPDVLGRHALAGGATPDPGNATFAVPEDRRVPCLHRVFSIYSPWPTSGPGGARGGAHRRLAPRGARHLNRWRSMPDTGTRYRPRQRFACPRPERGRARERVDARGDRPRPGARPIAVTVVDSAVPFGVRPAPHRRLWVGRPPRPEPRRTRRDGEAARFLSAGGGERACRSRAWPVGADASPRPCTRLSNRRLEDAGREHRPAGRDLMATVTDGERQARLKIFNTPTQPSLADGRVG
jgi:hypothetical protein